MRYKLLFNISWGVLGLPRIYYSCEIFPEFSGFHFHWKILKVAECKNPLLLTIWSWKMFINPLPFPPLYKNGLSLDLILRQFICIQYCTFMQRRKQSQNLYFKNIPRTENTFRNLNYGQELIMLWFYAFAKMSIEIAIII